MEGRKIVGLAARDTTGFLSPYSFNLRSLSHSHTLDLIIKYRKKRGLSALIF